jgi:hypothetical protein
MKPDINITNNDELENVYCKLDFKRQEILCVSFYPGEYPSEWEILPIYRDDTENLQEGNPLILEDAYNIKMKVESKNYQKIMTQCHWGVCRSAALAAALHYYYDRPQKANDILHSPHYAVNRWFYAQLAEAFHLDVDIWYGVKRRQFLGGLYCGDFIVGKHYYNKYDDYLERTSLCVEAESMLAINTNKIILMELRDYGLHNDIRKRYIIYKETMLKAERRDFLCRA